MLCASSLNPPQGSIRSLLNNHWKNAGFLLVITNVLACLSSTPFNQRPGYHFLPRANWMNDPNGPVLFNGVYHLFFQYNSNPVGTGPRVWGHATSSDLVYWTHQPIALSPSEPYNAGGIWSGSATTLGKDDIRLVYTTVCNSTKWMGCEVVCLAKPKNASDPLLVEWEQLSAVNPVIPNMPSSVFEFRDPTTAWQEHGMWYMLLGAALNEYKGGVALLYSSPDYESWSFVGPIANSSSPTAEGTMWECPDFYVLPTPKSLRPRHILKASCETKNLSYALGFGEHYWTGLFTSTSRTFQKELHSTYDFSDRFYASKTFVASNGRRVLWGWIQEDDSPASWARRGWAGVQSLPRVVAVLPGRDLLNIKPVVELRKLRRRKTQIAHSVPLPPGKPMPLSQLLPSGALAKGCQLEISLQLRYNESALRSFAFGGVSVLEDTEARVEHTDVLVSAAPSQVVPRTAFSSRNFNFTTVFVARGGWRGAQDCTRACRSTELCQGWTLRNRSCTLFASVYDCDLVGNADAYSGFNAQVLVNRSKSSLAADANKMPQGGGILNPEGRSGELDAVVNLQVFVDHSVIEVFVNGGEYRVTSRVYPTLGTSVGVSLLSTGPGVSLQYFTMFELASIW